MKTPKTHKKIAIFLSTVVMSALFLGSLIGQRAYAQKTLLPNSGATTQECNDFVRDQKGAFQSAQGLRDTIDSSSKTEGGVSRSDALRIILGCAVTTGNIRLYMLPFFVTYIIQFLIVIAGLVAVLFVVIGGFKYVTGGLVDDKDSGRKTITNALIGLVVALASWIIVDFVQIALTS